MKKKRIIIGSVITLLTVIAVLEVFDLHPRVTISRTEVIWSGFSQVTDKSLSFFFAADVSKADGTVVGRIYNFGPFSFIRFNDHEA
jgi:hypothetical protein